MLDPNVFSTLRETELLLKHASVSQTASQQNVHMRSGTLELLESRVHLTCT
jgi:hypothetical protein